MATPTYKVKYGDTLSGIAKASGTTVQNLLAANPSLKDPNKIYAGTSLNLTSTAPVSPTAPTTTTTPVDTKPKTIAERASLIPDAPTEDPALKSYYEEVAKSISTPDNEREIRDNIRNQYNAQFDALRIAAAGKIQDVRKAQEGQMGQARAIQARSGTLGSNFAGAENDTIAKNADEQVALINDEVNAKIAFLMGQSEKDYSAQIAAAREAKKAGADEYIKYMNERDSIKKTQVSNLAKMFAAQGIDPNTLTADEVSKLQKAYGVNLGSFKSLVDTEKEALTAKDTFNLTDGQARYVYDPKTGETKLIAENTKNFAPNKYSTGGGTGTKGTGVGGKGTSVAYDDPNYLLSVIDSSKGGRVLTQSEADPITKIKRVVGQAEVISSLVKNANTGPIMGIIRSNNPYDTKAKLLQAQVTALVPTLARGVYGEVGVLTDTDVERYTRTIASLKNTQDVNKAVMAMTLDIASKSIAAQLESMAAAGRDVSGYKNMYKDINSRVGTLKTQLGIGSTAPKTTTTSVPDVKVKAKDGRVITVPQDKVGAALKAGYTQVK